jgi:importin subunit beta-1
MQDPHPHVKDTTAWTIGRIFQFLHSTDIEPPLITPDSLPPIMTVLAKSLQDSSHISYRVCCAISSLAEGFQGAQGMKSCMAMNGHLMSGQGGTCQGYMSRLEGCVKGTMLQ